MSGPKMPFSLPSTQEAWDQWFDNQWDLTKCIDRAVEGQSEGKDDGFRLALYAAVIEHCAEAMRAYIPDVALEEEVKDGNGDEEPDAEGPNPT